MKRLLSTLFEEGESFSGKRPFGNSGWEGDLAEPLVRAGVLTGEFCEEDGGGYLDDYDQSSYERLVSEMIAAL